MRLISATFLGGCLLGFVVGCGSKHEKVEVPKNPAPPPKTAPGRIGGAKGIPNQPVRPAAEATQAPPNK